MIPVFSSQLLFLFQIDEKGEEWETEFEKVFKNGIPGVKIYRYSITG